jgi:hypothetical protein
MQPQSNPAVTNSDTTAKSQLRMAPGLSSDADSHTQEIDGSPPTDGVLPSVFALPSGGIPTLAHASLDGVPSNGDRTSPNRPAGWQVIALPVKPTMDEPRLELSLRLPPYQEPQ